MPSGSERTLRVNRPMSSPATIPFMVDPITMPTISGRVSGAEISAVRPSKIPSNPPSSIPNTGLDIRSPPCMTFYYASRAGH